eukprot:211477_1
MAHHEEAEVKEYFDTAEEIDKKTTKLVQLIKSSKHFIAFTGAGISTSAGIPDYRSGINTKLDTGAGKWAKGAAKKQGIEYDESKVKVKKSTLSAIPTLTHMSLVQLAKKGYLKCLLSQNTDGLHRRSGFPLSQLAELHGNSNLEICGKCGHQYLCDYRTRNNFKAKQHALTIGSKKDWKQKMKNENKPFSRRNHFTTRFCAKTDCNGELFDTIINFGECLSDEMLNFSDENSKKADICLALGSSLSVTPARDYAVDVAKNKGGVLCIVNIQKTDVDKHAKLIIHGKTDEIMKQVMKKLGLEIAEWRLQRYIKIDVVENTINITGIARDGIGHDILAKIALKYGDMLVEKTHDDDRKALGNALFKIDNWSNNESDEKKESNEEEFKLMLGFVGHYKEPDLEINLKEFILDRKDQCIILKLIYNPFDGNWSVPSVKEQLEFEEIKQIYDSLKN